MSKISRGNESTMQTTTAQNGGVRNPGNQENITFSINQILSPEGVGLESRNEDCDGEDIELDATNHSNGDHSTEYFERETCNRSGDMSVNNRVCTQRSDSCYYSGSYDSHTHGYYNSQYYPPSRLSNAAFYSNGYIQNQRSSYFGNKISCATAFPGSQAGLNSANGVVRNDYNSFSPPSCVFGLGNSELDARNSCKFTKNSSVGSNGHSVSSGSSGNHSVECFGESASPDLSPNLPTSGHTRIFDSEVFTNKSSIDQRQRHDNITTDDHSRFSGAFSASNYYNSYGYAAAAAAASLFNGSIAPSSGRSNSLPVSALSPIVGQTHHHLNHQAAAVAAVGSAVAAASNGGVIRVPAHRYVNYIYIYNYIYSLRTSGSHYGTSSD